MGPRFAYRRAMTLVSFHHDLDWEFAFDSRLGHPTGSVEEPVAKRSKITVMVHPDAAGIAISRRPAVRARLRALLGVGLLCATPSFVFGQTQPSTNRSRAFGPDACSPADPSYIHTAEETGGIPMFLQRSEAPKAFHLVRESTRNNVSTVFWATGTLDGKPQTFTIPVDSVTKRITFTFSADTKGNQLNLTQPSGGAIVEGLAGTEDTELNCGRILTVSSPEAGVWRAEITGTGRYWIEAQAQSDIYFVSVEFVKEGGRPGHEGLFRIQGQPVAGTAATLQASLSAGATKITEFYLFTEQGQTIQKLQMHAVNSDREFLEFVGSVDLPNMPFRVAVIGRDSNGKQYQRFFSNLFHAESVEVSAKLDFDELSAGSTKQVQFTLRNIGFPRTFKITVTDAHQFVSKVEPKELALGAGESGTVHVDLTVPTGTVPGVGDDLVVVAQSTAGPPTSNSSVVHLSVSSSSKL
jgi:von Willebrand factor A domain-containing protein 7